MSIADPEEGARFDAAEQRCTTDRGKAAPLPRDKLGLAPFDPTRDKMLAEQNTVLFWAYELVDAARLNRRHTSVARYHNHLRYMFDALYLGDDRGFFNRLCEQLVNFWVAYAWLFAMLCHRDEDELSLLTAVDLGFDDGLHGRSKVRHGLVASKRELVDTLLFDAPFEYADRPSECVRLTRLLHARFEDPTKTPAQRVMALDAHLRARVGAAPAPKRARRE